ncbi:GumC family protein [Desulfosediminicola flagellatus]|uniref:GumC family protein n=1 Tax=Desulfosediminicola flagellatus TaxID=2569541 RepID=UPI0010ACB3FF|nr:polysaccharide biosynthesis tyrosine autokinase [Desulfosediminicola flagellatus]
MIEEQRLHLRDFLRVIQKRQFIIATFFLITFIVVVIGTFSATPIYEASTQILVERSDPTLLTGKSSGNRYDPHFFETQSQIIRSHNVIKKVVEILALDTNYETYFPAESNKPSIVRATVASIKSFIADLSPSSVSADEATDSKGESWKKSKTDIFATIIKENIVVSQVAESGLLNIRYRSENPEFARLIANTIAQAYMEEIMAIKLNSSGYAIEWMTKKADTERTRLFESEKALQAFIKKHDIITVENHVAIFPQKLADLNVRMTAAETKRIELETLRSQIAGMRDTNENTDTIPGLSENKLLQSLRNQILKSEQNITELSHEYGEKHPVMIKARADLKILEQKKELEIRKSIQSINNEYELARNNELNIRKLLDQTKNEILDLNEKFIQYGILKREVDMNSSLYDALSLHIKEQGVTEYTQQVNVWVTEQAGMPEFPVSPHKKRNMLLGVILGLFGGVGVALFLEYVDNTVKGPGEVEGRTGVGVLGVVEPLKNGGYIEIATGSNSKSAFAESFRSLRTSIMLSSPDKPPKKILISSMMPDEGKTTTALNLAKTISMIANKVLLIDADLRRPSLHTIYDLPNSKGLSSYLAGSENEGLIHKIDDSSLYVMPSGPNPLNPSELFSSNRLQDMILSLEKEFDFIIIDSAPILGIPDSLLLSKVVDETIVVSRAGKTSYDSLQRGLKLYKDIQTPVLGIVINAIDMNKSEYQHYYGY